MFERTTIIAIGLLACAALVSTSAADAPPEDTARYKLTGQGFSDNGEFTFDFKAKAGQYADGLVRGYVTAVVDYPAQNYFPVLKAGIVCMEVDEVNAEVWLSGYVEETNLPDVWWVGRPIVFWLHDGGPGGEDYFGGDAAANWMSCEDRPGVPNEELVIVGDFKLETFVMQSPISEPR